MYEQGNTQQIEMETMIAYVKERIQFLAQNLNLDGISANFGAIAGKTAVDDYGMFGSFIFDIYIFQGMVDTADMLLEAGDVTEGPTVSVVFNDAVIAAFEAYSLLNDANSRDLKSNFARAYYPKGRNKASFVSDPNKNKQFKNVANQNFGPRRSTEDELVSLCMMAEKLEQLQKQHLKVVSMEKKETVEKAINKLSKSASKSGGIDMMNAGHRVAV